MHDRAFEVSKHCAVLQRQRRLAVWGVKRSMQAPPAQPSPPPWADAAAALDARAPAEDGWRCHALIGQQEEVC